MPHVNKNNKKPVARNRNLVKTESLGLEWTMNGLEKIF